VVRAMFILTKILYHGKGSAAHNLTDPFPFLYYTSAEVPRTAAPWRKDAEAEGNLLPVTYIPLDERVARYITLITHSADGGACFIGYIEYERLRAGAGWHASWDFLKCHISPFNRGHSAIL
jgi:hypothetical protein